MLTVGDAVVIPHQGGIYAGTISHHYYYPPDDESATVLVKLYNHPENGEFAGKIVLIDEDQLFVPYKRFKEVT